MATNVKSIKVLDTNLKQHKFDVTPAIYLTDIRDQVCKKLQVPGEKYGNYVLKHKQRSLEMSQPIRTSGLINNALLELVVTANTPLPINIALQLPAPESSLFPDGRLKQKLPSNFTIWQILRQAESGEASAGKNLNITARGVAQVVQGAQAGSGQLYYEMPHIVIENRTMSSFADLQKTLSQLGYYSGGVLMRLSFQKTDKPLIDAMAEIEQYFSSGEETSSSKAQEEDPTTASLESLDAATRVSATSSAPIDNDLESSSEHHSAITDANVVTTDMGETPASDHRPMTIFSAPSSDTPVAALRPYAEDDYTPGISQLKAHQKLLNSQTGNKRLLSDQELEQKAKTEEEKLDAIKSIRIRARFPDGSSAVWVFSTKDTGASLYAEIRGVMANPTLPFRLTVTDAKTPTTIREDSSTLIKGYRLKNTLVNFTWEDPSRVPKNTPFLKDGVAGQAQKVVVPETPEVEVEDEKSQPSQPTKARSGGDGSSGKMPKWLKGLGKK
ncbi:GLUT4 regulating protein TUG-domain-containing protein [Xylariaceae sp. FL1272]|nr:GLUT4 regulating protein TUG-domain-containing protein [Xylariaceae sp. FL1272]